MSDIYQGRDVCVCLYLVISAKEVFEMKNSGGKFFADLIIGSKNV